MPFNNDLSSPVTSAESINSRTGEQQRGRQRRQCSIRVNQANVQIINTGGAYGVSVSVRDQAAKICKARVTEEEDN